MPENTQIENLSFLDILTALWNKIGQFCTSPCIIWQILLVLALGYVFALRWHFATMKHDKEKRR
jgi:hypothetical protein